MEKGHINFLPPRLAAILNDPKQSAVLFLKVIGGLFLVLFLLAYFIPMEEITKGMGKVVPSSRVQVITNMEGGIIKELLINEGEVVEKDQILVRLDPTISEAKYKQDRDNYYRYLAASERLHACIDGKENVTFSEDLAKNAPEILAVETTQFKARKDRLKNEVQVAQADADLKEQNLAETREKLKHLQNQLVLVKEQVDILKPLIEKNLSSKIDFLKLQREQVEMEGQINQTTVAIKRCEYELQESKEKVKQIPIRFQNEELGELREVETKVADHFSAMISEGDRLKRTEIRAPRRGIIKEIKSRTIGGVIRPGDDLIELVPLEDTLLIEVQVQPSDVAFLAPGLPGLIKITAYDYSIYGGLNATVEQISADTIQEKEHTYYRVFLRTDKNVIDYKGKIMPIIPGMQAEARILTGHRTLWTYLMKPIMKTHNNALTER